MRDYWIDGDSVSNILIILFNQKLDFDFKDDISILISVSKALMKRITCLLTKKLLLYYQR